MTTLAKYSFGIGDRFAHQAAAQLRAFVMLEDKGVTVSPVWNKSNREHTFVGSTPPSVIAAAKAAVEQAGWKHDWHVDADHIGLKTVGPFLECSDFFTIDVADFIGVDVPAATVDEFVARHPELMGELSIGGMASPLKIDAPFVRQVAGKYLAATKAAGDIYRHIANAKGEDNFIAEVSMDETDDPQRPVELLIILAALADENIQLQSIAPKFTGRFNKGVDYVGDLDQFKREFHDDLAIIAHAIKQYQLPANLKLSVHSGSDKFSLYPIIREALQQTGAGVHLKTAGTTWLEELIGLAEAGGDGLALTKQIYGDALDHIDELCTPYASVIDIDRSSLPTKEAVDRWDGPQMAAAIRHIQDDPRFNPSVRQLLHVSFKLAAKAGDRYTDLLVKHEQIVGKQVTDNLFQRHLKPLFLG